MATNSAISVVDLDFDTIKQNLKTYLSGQSRLKDYDYEGSNISVVLDLLAYNTYLQNFYINMIANEMFIDSALLKDSVISHAKELNYLPRSAHSAKALVNVQVYPPATNLPSSINVDKYTKFTSTVDGVTYSFYTEDDYIVIPTSNSSGQTVWSIANVEIYEGVLTREYFTVDTTNNFSINISNQYPDLRHINVNVRESNTSTSNVNWARANNLFGINATSNVYFVEPAKNEKYNITFGDGIFGRKPSVGNIVEVTYRISSRELPNNARSFRCNGIGAFTNVVVTTVSNAVGGAEPETIEEIRKNATKSFQVQERAVTADDFKIITQANFPEVENILAFGGENLVPPKYGKVILAIDLVNSDGVPETKKREIQSYLSKRTPVGIDVEVITPEFLYIETTAQVNYNVALTTATPATIQSKTLTALTNYAANNINTFNAVWRNSKAVAAIDAADPSIISSQLLNRPFKKVSPSSTIASYKLEFDNALKKDSVLTTSTAVDTYEPAVESTLFTYLGSDIAYFMDDGQGNLAIVRSDSANLFTVLKANAGTINYETGLVNILPISISRYSGAVMKFYARTVSRDIRSYKQTILQSNAEDVKVNVVQERI